MLRLSLELPLYRASFAERREVALAAEAAGFDGVWVPDHLVAAREGEAVPAECWTTLSAIAATTVRVALGPLVLVLALRNPALVAREAATLDRLSGGRLTLALGLGGFTYRRAARALGLDPLGLGERARRLEDGIATMRGIWQAAGARRVSICLAGRSRELLEVAARAGDTWNCPFAAELGDAARSLDALCARAGRPRGEITRSVYSVAAIARTAGEAERILAGAGAMARLFGDVRRDHVFGTPAAALERLAGFARAGASEVMLHVLGDHETRLAAIDLIGAQIVPRLKDL